MPSYSSTSSFVSDSFMPASTSDRTLHSRYTNPSSWCPSSQYKNGTSWGDWLQEGLSESDSHQTSCFSTDQPSNAVLSALQTVKLRPDFPPRILSTNCWDFDNKQWFHTEFTDANLDTTEIEKKEVWVKQDGEPARRVQ